MQGLQQHSRADETMLKEQVPALPKVAGSQGLQQCVVGSMGMAGS